MNFDGLFTFNRAIAVRLSGPLARTPLTPNQITSAALACGVASAFSMARGTRSGMIAGALLLQLSFVLDNCDGEIARRKGMKSRFGMWFDFVADLFVDFALWTGLAAGAVASGVTPAVWLVAAAAGIGSTVHFAVVVTRRLRGGTGKEPSSAANPVVSALHVLGHDGDPSLLVWAFALAGYPGWLLVCGCAYIHVLWIVTLATGRREAATVKPTS